MIRKVIYTLMGIGTVGYLLPMYWDYRLALNDDHTDVVVRLICSFPTMFACVAYVEWGAYGQENGFDIGGMIFAGIIASVCGSMMLGWIMFPETQLMGMIAVGIILVYTVTEFSMLFVVNDDR